MKPLKLILLVSTPLLLSSCFYQEPAGPAEQIGKGVDQIIQGSQQLDQQYGVQPKDDPVNGNTPSVDVTGPHGVNDEKGRYDYESDKWWREHDKNIQHDED